MGDYFNHWLAMGRKQSQEKLPRVYYVNWFQKDASGKFLWPGFGENSRVLKWIFERTSGKASAVASPIGYLPEALDMKGIESVPLKQLLEVDRAAWLKECDHLAEYFKIFGDRMPDPLNAELIALRTRLCDY